MPIPQPRPREPRSYQSEGVQGMVNEISSNSWDSIHQQASSQLRVQKSAARAAMTPAGTRTVRQKSRVAFSLQAQDDQPGARRKPVLIQDAPEAPKRQRRPLTKLERRVVAACLSVSVTLVVCAAFVAIQTHQQASLSAGVVQQPDQTRDWFMEVEPESAPAQPASAKHRESWSGAGDRAAADPAEQIIPDPEVLVETLVRALLL